MRVILLQNAEQLYCKMCQIFYYKMRQLLQSSLFETIKTESFLDSIPHNVL